MKMWAIKEKKSGKYLIYDGDFNKSFDGIRLFKLKKDAINNIRIEQTQELEKAVKIEIKEIK